MSTITTAASFGSASNWSGSFIPSLWSAKMIQKFYATSVFGDIANTDYEGEIKGYGDKVVINTVPDATIINYTMGNLGTHETPYSAPVELNIDKAKAFRLTVNDILTHQSKPKLMDVLAENAAQRMRMTIDSNVIYNSFTQGSANNKGATAGVKSSSFDLGTDAAPLNISAASPTVSALTTITRLASVLDEQNVPDEGRWLVIDPWTRNLLMQGNLAQAYITGDDKSIIRNGLIGTIDRFKIYVSNQLPIALATQAYWTGAQHDATNNPENTVSKTAHATAKEHVIMAGHKTAITFASQIVNTETLRNPSDFGDLMRGLQVFGYKVVKPESLAMAIVY